MVTALAGGRVEPLTNNELTWRCTLVITSAIAVVVLAVMLTVWHYHIAEVRERTAAIEAGYKPAITIGGVVFVSPACLPDKE